MTSTKTAAEPESGLPCNGFKFTFDSLLDTSNKTEVDLDQQDYGRINGTSLTDSIFNYPVENGRTYHAYRAGSYYFPNDQIETERLDSQHEIIKIVLGGRNFLAPWTTADPPRKVLDVGTGTGRWAVEVGDAFPGTQVLGIDLSPIQPTLVPPNVTFFVDDATEGDAWAGDGFDGIDFIHTRFTTGCWRSFRHDIIDKAYRTLQPGGWLECQELEGRVRSDDGSLAAHAPLALWCQDLADAGARAHRPLAEAAPQLRAWFEAAGFVDVREQVYRLPTNGWARDPRLKRVGDMWQVNLQDGLQAFSYALMHRVLGRTKREIEVSLVNVRKDLANPQVHAYSLFYVVCGRKPTPHEAALAASVASASSVSSVRSVWTSASSSTMTPTIW